MNPFLVLGIVLGYFVLLMIISWLTSRNADTQAFFTANRKSPWYLVAFGMVGATLSGVTFISVPGEVGNTAFSYLQFVFWKYCWLLGGSGCPFAALLSFEFGFHLFLSGTEVWNKIIQNRLLFLFDFQVDRGSISIVFSCCCIANCVF